MTQHGFYYDATRCTGCKTCQLACSDRYDLPASYFYRRVYEYSGGSWEKKADGTFAQDAFVYFTSVSCNHCDKATCVAVCPTGAMNKDADNGIVSVDSTKCIGCGYCHMSCPYNAPTVDHDKGHSVKCDGCKARVLDGKKPICVEACSLRALEFGPMEELSKKYEGDANVAPLPSPEFTKPNLIIKKSVRSKASDDKTGTLSNRWEVM
jgi:anaerobic dimethyl sulfoxide reductase subunit B (iron-sulfur subunit)